jgi:hypothetical protein
MDYTSISSHGGKGLGSQRDRPEFHLRPGALANPRGLCGDTPHFMLSMLRQMQ